MIEQLLKERILILDGGMGSMIQRFHLQEDDYRGTQFAHLPGSMKGNGEALNITRPDVIQSIHEQYLQAGADIIETNTLNATTISMADYGMESYVREINLAAARLAKEVCDKYTRQNPGKPRFVAGSIGPTNKTASLSPDVSNPAFRSVTFDELRTAYMEQIDALFDGGADVILIETSFDTLNVKAALMAAEDVFAVKGKPLPLMVSFTLAGKNGRILSGQTLEAAWVSVSHANLLSVGLNCSFGARDMKPFLKELGRIAHCYISAYPNAGLPNSLGQYDETPETMAPQIQEYLDENLVNIIGGCCGTTPEHIAMIAKLVENEQCKIQGKEVKGKKVQGKQVKGNDELLLAGLELFNPLSFNPVPFILIGERCNVAGSKKFLRLIKEQKYEEALAIARQQVDDGAQILDVNVDDGLLDGVREMTHFLNLMASEPDIARVPVMIDSSDWNIIEAGLKCLQGKSIVNSISLKNGEDDFLSKARKIKSYGAAVIAMAFDEQGQADTCERKIEVCRRMYHLLTGKAGFKPQDIIFDPNILAVATGIEAHNTYALDFIRATEWIKQNLPGAKVSGGVSNLSFSFRGNNYVREAMHTVFLYHAIRKGMDMGIVNPSVSLTYEDIPVDLRDIIEDVVLNRNAGAVEKLMEYVARHSGESRNFPSQGTAGQTRNDGDWRTLPVEERLKYALIKGVGDYLEEDLNEALQIYSSPVEIIDQALMAGMNEVGTLFGEGKMFLPQVVKTARTMKKAVAILQPHIEASRSEDAAKAGKILFATVKGDVHDIGKNITSVILSCNNYEIVDLGVMVPTEEIIRRAKDDESIDIVALSGLITPSLSEMATVASEMEKANLKQPLLIGGASTSALHTALKIEPLYSHPVVQVSDASQAVPVANQLLNPATRAAYIQAVKTQYQGLRENNGNKKSLVSLEYARAHALKINHSEIQNPKPNIEGTKIIHSIPIKELLPYINWAAFLVAWKLPVKYANSVSLPSVSADGNKEQEAFNLLQDAKNTLQHWAENDKGTVKAIIGFYPVRVENETLIINDSQGMAEQVRHEVPFLRQQEQREDDTYKSLIDFIRPEGDYIGVFAATAGHPSASHDCACGCRHSDDTYQQLLEQTLEDRLAEATSEYLHEKVRKEYWGYASGESFSPAELLKAPYRGIRPASGYPVHPDLSLNFTIDKLLNIHQIGIELTPNGAMSPTASVAGLYIAHPQSDYFFLGKIGDDQLSEYAQKRGIPVDEAKKWLGF
ncbi:MAG: methionine synthase [Dysgonamonadaceae bacterium]|jgi:5-methyltetrahydrofolate--homocysteine methyltransferase|nr:methionine synthase [Dysgonamonadaceae bacterium]